MVSVRYELKCGYKTNGFQSWGCFYPLMRSLGLEMYIPRPEREYYGSKESTQVQNIVADVAEKGDFSLNPFSATKLWYKPDPFLGLTFAQYNKYMDFMTSYPYFKRVLGKQLKDSSFKANPNIPLKYTISAWAALRSLSENPHSVMAFYTLSNIFKVTPYRPQTVDPDILWWASFFAIPRTDNSNIWKLLMPAGSHNPMCTTATVQDIVRMRHNLIKFEGKPFKEFPMYHRYIPAIIKEDRKEMTKENRIYDIMGYGGKGGELGGLDHVIQNINKLAERVKEVEKSMGLIKEIR